MIFDIIKDALNYSTQDLDSIMKISVLYIITCCIIPFLCLMEPYKYLPQNIIFSLYFIGIIIPLRSFIIISGYSYNITKESLKGTINMKDKIPKLDNYTL